MPKLLPLPLLILILSLALTIFTCKSPTDQDDVIPIDTTPRITSPVEGTELLAGDTISLTWIGEISNPEFYYNFNDSMGMLSSPLWEMLPDSSVTLLGSNEARIILPITRFSISENFLLKIEEPSDSTKTLTSGKLSIDHIILTYPIGGEQFTVGEKVTITWRSNKRMDRVEVGLTANETQSPVIIADSTIFYPAQEYQWTVGTESEPMDFPSEICKIYVKSYDDATWSGMSGYRGLLVDFSDNYFMVNLSE